MNGASRCFVAMGTFVTVAVTCSARQGRRAHATLAELQRAIEGFGHDAWAFGGGALGRLNESLLAGRRVTIPPRLRPLFERAWMLRELTGGRFEPRLGALIRLWGFDGVARTRASLPATRERAAALAALDRAPAYDGSARYGAAPGVAWDFGGIGKGYIVDLALAHLQARGFGGASINAGGHSAVRGSPRGRAWRIGVRNSRTRGHGLVASLDARDEAVVTHGQEERYFVHGSRRYGHLLDPVTGQPVAGLRSLTVVHPDGALADAAGAALFVAGSGWPPLAARWGLDHVLAVTESGALQATPKLAARLNPPPDVTGDFAWTNPSPISPDACCCATA